MSFATDCVMCIYLAGASDGRTWRGSKRSGVFVSLKWVFVEEFNERHWRDPEIWTRVNQVLDERHHQGRKQTGNRAMIRRAQMRPNVKKSQGWPQKRRCNTSNTDIRQGAESGYARWQGSARFLRHLRAMKVEREIKPSYHSERMVRATNFR